MWEIRSYWRDAQWHSHRADWGGRVPTREQKLVFWNGRNPMRNFLKSGCSPPMPTRTKYKVFNYQRQSLIWIKRSTFTRHVFDAQANEAFHPHIRPRSQSHKWKRLTGQKYDWLLTWSRLGVAKWLAATCDEYDWRRRLSQIKCVF